MSLKCELLCLHPSFKAFFKFVNANFVSEEMVWFYTSLLTQTRNIYVYVASITIGTRFFFILW